MLTSSAKAWYFIWSITSPSYLIGIPCKTERCARRGSKARLKRSGDNGLPCLVPHLREKRSPSKLLSMIWATWSVRISIINLSRPPRIPIRNKTCCIYWWEMRSKALLKSTWGSLSHLTPATPPALTFQALWRTPECSDQSSGPW